MKIKGIKKAVGDYKHWLNLNRFHDANIMLNKATGEVWTDCFVSCNNWKEYSSDSIISLLRYIRERTDEEISMNLLKKYATEIIHN